jgi:protein TonB
VKINITFLFWLASLVCSGQSEQDTAILKADSILAIETFVEIDENSPIEFRRCETPVLPGGLDSLGAAIYANMPRINKVSEIKGKVIIVCTIDASGILSNIEVARGLNPRINSICLNAVKRIEAWTPAHLSNGDSVPLRCGIPFRFE